MFSSRRELENLIALQRAEITDLRAALRAERDSFSEERRSLLDRILVLTNPAAHQLLHPKPPHIPLRNTEGTKQRSLFPNGRVSGFRPPDPPAPLGPNFEADVETEAEEKTPS